MRAEGLLCPSDNSPMQFLRAILTPLVAATLLAATAPLVMAQNRGDDTLLEMQQAFRKGDRNKLAQLLPAARGHALEPWAAYWELRVRLGEASPQEIQSFMQRYAGTYQEDRLRNDWLLLLGQRRDWSQFAEQHPSYRMSDDREVRCYALLIDQIKGTAPATVAEDVRSNWYAIRDADDGCTHAARELYGYKKLSALDVWRKARLGVEANRPRVVRTAVEIVSPESLPQVKDVLDAPSKYLLSRATAASNAHGYFANVTKDSDLNDDLLGWKVRAALRAGQWKAVGKAVDAMGPEGRQDSTWVYWKARSLLAGRVSDAERAEARQLLEGIAGTRGFYEQLALEELGQRITTPPAPAPLTAAERAAAASACQREVWDRCINTSERTKSVVDVTQRFPTPFRSAVVERANGIGLDPAYVYGLIRQESRFIMDARSHVGASGLMQVMPATARWTAKKIGLNGFTADQINDRDTNITIGTAYLKLALDDFAGSMPMAAAAYNAGPGRPRSWRNGPVLDAAIWAENVPFAETRDYVKKVLSNTTNYAAMLTGQPQSLKSRLGTIGPRDAALPEVNKDLP